MSAGILKQARYRLEWLAMMSVQGLGSLFPVSLASAAGGALAGVIGPATGRQKKALHNLRRCYPEQDDAWHRQTAKAMWQNQARTIFEYACLDKLAPGGPRCEVEGLEHLEALARDGRPGLVFSAHYGNWELVTRAMKLAGVSPLHLVYRPANNPLLNNHIRSLQARCGAELIAKGAPGARALMAAMKAGSHVVMLVDQKMNDGIPVPFFGRDAMTAPALAQLALRFDAPVVPVRAIRLRDARGNFQARFRVEISPPLDPVLTGERQADVAALMGQVNRIIEDWVREDPAQWLWLHKRWPD